MTAIEIALPEIEKTDRYRQRRRLLIAALREQRDRQIRDCLEDGLGGFCIVGLGNRISGSANDAIYLEQPYRDFAEYYGMSIHDVRSLADRNDAGATFEELARAVESIPIPFGFVSLYN